MPRSHTPSRKAIIQYNPRRAVTNSHVDPVIATSTLTPRRQRQRMHTVADPRGGGGATGAPPKIGSTNYYVFLIIFLKSECLKIMLRLHESALKQ